MSDEPLPPEEIREAQLQKAKALLEIERRTLSKSFRDFIPEAFRMLEPETQFVGGWHIDAIADHLEAVSRGQIRNLIINVPPRHMKSLTVSVLWPAWEWASRAWIKYICTSYGASLALRDGTKMRTLVSSIWYQRLWNHRVRIKADQNAKEEWHNESGGYRISTGYGGKLMGGGGDRIIVDDPHKPNEAESDLMRESIWDWWKNTLLSRAMDQRTVAKVVIMQRVHESDLVGHLLDEGGWVHLSLPTEYEARPFVYPKARPPITTDPRTVEGELLWPERFGHPEVETLKKAGPYVYSAQQQQRPAPASGGIIKREWFKFYDVDPDTMAASCDQLIQSWDLAVKGTTRSDYVAGQVWGKRGADTFLIARLKAQLDFPATCRALESMSARWPKAIVKLVEDKANGPAVVAELKHKIPGLVEQPVNGDKTARLSAVSGYVESGNVYLPHPSRAPYVEDFIAELCAFPKAPHDDETDAFSQAMDRLYVSVGAQWDFAEYAALVAGDVAKERELGGEGWKETTTPGGVQRVKQIGGGVNW